MKIPFVLTLALLLAAPAVAGEGELPRRGMLGVRFEPPAIGGEGLVVRAVFPGTAASKMGLEPGDVLLEANGRPAARLGEVLGGLVAGDEVRLRLSRNGEELVVAGPLGERPRESSDAYAVEYGHVALPDGTRLRTILTRPDGDGPFPALLLVQGLGPMSVDFGGGGTHPYRRLVDLLTREGWVTLRVEKPGVGDSEGGPHTTVDFETETAGFAAGMAHLAGLPFVDREDLFLFGHSMGGIMAPLIARSVPFRGAIVYGTSAKTWTEYELENDRRQAELAGADPAATDEALRRKAALFRDLYFSDLTLEEVLERHPESSDEFPGGLQYRVKEPTFFRQIANTNLAAAWREFPGRVLALWGEGDFVCGPEDHEIIARIVNGERPGRAEFRRVPGMDHGFTAVADRAESFRNLREGVRPPVNEAIFGILTGWLEENRKPREE